MLMIIGLIFCTSDITQMVVGMSAHLSAQGAFVCFVVHNVCPVDVIAYSNASFIFTILFELNTHKFNVFFFFQVGELWECLY